MRSRSRAEEVSDDAPIRRASREQHADRTPCSDFRMCCHRTVRQRGRMPPGLLCRPVSPVLPACDRRGSLVLLFGAHLHEGDVLAEREALLGRGVLRVRPVQFPITREQYFLQLGVGAGPASDVGWDPSDQPGRHHDGSCRHPRCPLLRSLPHFHMRRRQDRRRRSQTSPLRSLGSVSATSEAPGRRRCSSNGNRCWRSSPSSTGRDAPNSRTCLRDIVGGWRSNLAAPTSTCLRPHVAFGSSQGRAYRMTLPSA